MLTNYFWVLQMMMMMLFFSSKTCTAKPLVDKKAGVIDNWLTDSALLIDGASQTEECKLICIKLQLTQIDGWGCGLPLNTKCHTITQEMMGGAETMLPRKPFLKNVSSTPTFGIIIIPNIGALNFEDGFLADYPKLYFFGMRQNPIEKIGEKMFKGVQHLKMIIITQCSSLYDIHENVFHGMTSLTDLDLTHNNLSKIGANHFRTLQSLQNLYLSNNHISFIHEDAFADLTELQSLRLSSNDIVNVSSKTFSNLTNLRRLYLEATEIRLLPSDIFQPLRSLEIIHLYLTPLSSIHSKMFYYSRKLKAINVGCCIGISGFGPCVETNLTLYEQSFATKSELQEITVNGCLTELKPAVFHGIQARQVVLLNNNELRKIDGRIFQGMIRIYFFVLADGGLETIENDSFHYFTELNVLLLYNNKIKFIHPGTFDHMSTLTRLDLSENFLTVITPHYFKGLTSLIELHLYGNIITEICGNAFSSLSKLENLTLSYNYLSNLSQVSFYGLASLSYLDVSFNLIKRVASSDFENLNYMTSLRLINLRGNQIYQLEMLTLNLKLKQLDVRENKLVSINRVFGSNLQISNLLMSKNEIKKINEYELQLMKISYLLLDDNNLETLEFLLELDSIPQYLDLSFNQIKEIDDTLSEFLLKVKMLNIHNNPWKCSTHLRDRNLMQFLVSQNITSCCPEHCHCFINRDKSVIMNCQSQNKSSLPPFLPYEKIKLEYPNNTLKSLSFTREQENITFLNLQHNKLTSINGPTITLLKNLTYLDLSFNFLQTIPNEFEQFKTAKVYLEGNLFDCSKCSLINTLSFLSQATPQNLSCIKKQIFHEAQFACLLKLTIAPYVSMGIIIIILFIVIYNVCRMLYLKKLSHKYEQVNKPLDSREHRKAYERECKIHKDVDHHNIRKMHKNIVTWIPKRMAHLYFEKVQCSLREAILEIPVQDIPLDKYDLTRQLLSALHFLHCRDAPIYHGNLNMDTVYLQINDFDQSWTLKIGDFNQSQLIDKNFTSGYGILQMQKDLNAAAQIIFCLFTKKEKIQMIEREELMDVPEIDACILILALQHGMTAAEALEAAPFHSAEQRVSILGELNGLLKGMKNHKKSATVFKELEENASLVIGGKGAWNKLFEHVMMEEFALRFDGYNITSYVDLLRIIRNIFQHGNEVERAMLAAFKTKNPTPDKMLLGFSQSFPFFYLHSLYCYYKLFKERSASMSHIYMKTYQDFETFICNLGLTDGTISPLQKAGVISIHYKSPFKKVEDVIVVNKLRSCIYVNDIFPKIFEKTEQLWKDVPEKDILFKNHAKLILNPYSKSTFPSTPNYGTTVKECILEGSILEVLKPELKIQLPLQLITMKFRLTDNVKAVRGLAMKYQSQASGSKDRIKLENITITLDGQKLWVNQKLVDLDFADNIFTVNFVNVEE